MSLQSRLASLITELGTDYKFLRSMITGSNTGTLASLTTTTKTSVVAAVNEVSAKADYSAESYSFAASGALTVRTGASRLPIKGGTFTIVSVAASVGTAPTGAAVIVDVNKGGTTIYGTQANRPSIAVSTNTATVGTHSVTTVTDGDYLTVDIDQVGSTVAGSDLVVIIRLQRTA